MADLMGLLALMTIATFFLGIPVLAAVGFLLVRYGSRSRKEGRRVRFYASGGACILLAIAWGLAACRGFQIEYGHGASPDGHAEAFIRQRWAFDWDLVVRRDGEELRLRPHSGTGHARPPKAVHWLPAGTAVYLDNGERVTGELRDDEDRGDAVPRRHGLSYGAGGVTTAGRDVIVELAAWERAGRPDLSAGDLAQADYLRRPTPQEKGAFDRH